MRTGAPEAEAFRSIRLEALQESPDAFGTSLDGALAEPPAFFVQGHVPASTAPLSFREIERYGLELRARAHQRYPRPTPEQREKIEAKIARLVKAFSERGGNTENLQAGQSSLPVEPLPTPTPAAQAVRHPPVSPPPARTWEGPGLFSAF